MLSGNYACMRELWSQRVLTEQAHVPVELTGVTYVDENTLEYGSSVRAKTLRGVLLDALEPELALELFEHVVSMEETVYSWRVRGPRIFKLMTRECVLGFLRRM